MVHSLGLTLTLTLTFQVLKIMTPIVLVFSGIKIMVEKDYQIDWSVILVYINLIHVWQIIHLLCSLYYQGTNVLFSNI